MMFDFRLPSLALIFSSTLLLLAPHTADAADAEITSDPHRTPSGFFDIHVCNWPDRYPFFLTLFGTERYAEISSIEILAPDNSSIGELDLTKFTVTKNKGKPERHVFLTQLKIPENRIDGWYSAKINFRNGSQEIAHDFVIHQVMGRASSLLPEDHSEDIKMPDKFSWDAVPGATLYKVFIKDMWGGDKIIHTSELIKTNSYKLPADLLKPGGYYAWRVHARDLNEHVQLGDFNAGSLSQWVEFSVAE